MKKVFPLALLLSTASLFASFAHAQTIVCVDTNLDTFCMQMENDNSLAAANFLRYVDNKSYDNTFIHRSVRNGYLEGGSWQASLDPTPVVTDAPVHNEFDLPSTSRSVSLVTLPGQPDSATSGWRINVADNSSVFTKDNSGAVFATILANQVNGDGMDVVNRLAKLPVYQIPSANGFLDQAPMLQLDNKITADDVVQVKHMYRFNGTLDDFNTTGIVPLQDMEDVTCMQTNLSPGELCFQLYADATPNRSAAPKTVANFLQYVNSHAYDNSFIHRYEPGFVFQGGGYSFVNGTTVAAIPELAPVVNEYGVDRPNTYGTIAMAKISATNPDGSVNPAGGPDSATNQWFINIGDNTSSLGAANNGGFAVFGALIPSSYGALSTMTSIADALTQDVSVVLNNASLTTVPMIQIDTPLSANDFITVQQVYQTQRDVSLAAGGVVVDPLNYVVAMGDYVSQYSGIGVRIPIRIANGLYMIILTAHTNTDAENSDAGFSNGKSKFDLDIHRIYTLIENGRIAPTFDSQASTITIPSVRVATNIYINVVLKLVSTPDPDNAILYPYIFELQDGYEQM